LFAVLGAFLYLLSFTRARHSVHDFADRNKEQAALDHGLQTMGQENGRNFGRPFVTAGWIVIELVVVVAALEIAMLVLILTTN
jgi:hypothetical protein